MAEGIGSEDTRNGVNRRTMLKSGVAAAAVLGGPFTGLTTRAAATPRRHRTELFPVRDKRDGQVRLHLPHGFQYRSFHDTSTPVVVDDGTVLPPNHDGMGAFAASSHRGNRNVLVRNHELNNPPEGADRAAYQAALFSRLEGQVDEDGVVYFCSTQGGSVVTADPPSGFGDGNGQVWAYDTRTATLSIVYESPGRGTLDLPDNVTSSADGTLVLCEDNDEDNYLRGLSRRGAIWDIALNRLAGMFDSEFAGSTFSPDGHTLFVNIQHDPALSFAIWGPWPSIGV